MSLKRPLVRADTDGISATRKSVMPQQIFSFLFALFIGAVPIASVPASANATLARIDVRITTSSDWTQVEFRPGRIAAHRVVSAPDAVTVTPLENGFKLDNPGRSTRTVVLSAVFEETTRAPNIRVALRKGSVGTATVDVQNRSAKPFVAASLLNGLPRSTNGTRGADAMTAILTRTRAQFFGSGSLAVKRVDDRRLVLAAYYPWYFGGGYNNAQIRERPSQPRATDRVPGVLSLTEQARAAGIDGFVVSWAGEGYSGRSFDLALAAAQRTGGYVTPYLESLRAHKPGEPDGKADPLIVLEWLSDVLDRADNPAFLRSGGVPVVFVWQMGSVNRLGWHRVLTELSNRGKPVRLIGDAASSYGVVQWGVHEYNPNFLSASELAKHNRELMLDTRLLGAADETAPHLYVATVSPGYDDRLIPGRTTAVVPRGDTGEHYRDTWEAAIGAQPDWILITSWNEWYESTMIEPSVRYGDLALRQTAELAARFKS